MYKDRDDNNGKLTMGPFWDYNLALVMLIIVMEELHLDGK